MRQNDRGLAEAVRPLRRDSNRSGLIDVALCSLAPNRSRLAGSLSSTAQTSHRRALLFDWIQGSWRGRTGHFPSYAVKRAVVARTLER